MKILIVDDEPLIARYIAQCITDVSAEDTVVDIALSGAKALAKVQETPQDLVFADITMPKMDGLELLETLKREYPNMAVMLLTCHEDFEYARKAMYLRADDYILKSEVSPEFMRKKLDDFAANQQKASALSLEQRDGRPPVAPEFKGIQVISRSNPREVQQLLQETSFIAVSFLNIQGNLDILLQNFPTEFKNPVLYPHNAILQVLIFNIDSSSADCSLEEKEQCADRYIAEKSCCVAGPLDRSQLYYRLAQIPRSIQSTVQKLETDFYGGKPSKVLAPQESRRQIQLMMMDIASRIERLDVPSCCDRVQDMLAFAAAAHPDLETLFDVLQHTMELISYLEADPIIAPELPITPTYSELQSRVLSRLNTVRSSVKQYSKAITSAIEYIKLHYAEELTLNLVAEHVFLNREYLSRHFKQEVGVNFSKYLMDIRLREAMRMLRTTALRTGEIAERVGMPNVSYFTSAFKKQYGVSPSKIHRR
ncbi:response regulator [uncultured Dysosmobacter sp.]|uniref:response regulator n=1 Tax=uncultured Dysosmobacter sp. TaxID=2591384 RepID=UPI002617E601|nr:response regulator [uncultured Dysosmobacter sp.]